MRVRVDRDRLTLDDHRLVDNRPAAIKVQATEDGWRVSDAATLYTFCVAHGLSAGEHESFPPRLWRAGVTRDGWELVASGQDLPLLARQVADTASTGSYFIAERCDLPCPTPATGYPCCSSTARRRHMMTRC